MKISAVANYLEKKKTLADQSPRYRNLCVRCIQPEFSCYCPHVQEFDPQINFVILIHPIEVRRRIATGRMSSLCLRSSHLIMGQDYSQNSRVNQLVAESGFHSVILYPGVNSKNLTYLSNEEKSALVPKEKKLRIFVIDGTWATAKKMVRQSENLISLPRICFTPENPSNFRVRKQPHAGCYSTIEAIHHTLELLGDTQGFPVESRAHDRLIYVFDSMVERQLEFIQESHLRSKNG